MKSNQHKQHNSEEYRHSRRRKYELIHFTKMHGLGNDFMIVETLTQQINFSKELIQSWSDRHTGIGFDQLLVVAPPQTTDVDFQYIIFNADGSEAGQCGNGARAIARFIYDQKLSLKHENTVATCTNRMKIRVLESGLSQVDMDAPVFKHDQIPFALQGQANTPETMQQQASNKKSSCEAQTLTVLGQEVKFYPISVGNPHAVIFLDNINVIDSAIPQAIQNHPSFPEGVNVGFAQVTGESSIRLRVFERGAGETQACGSGATAAAIAAIESQHVKGPEVQVALKGGDLAVFWDGHKLEMTGPAVRVFTGRMLIKNHSMDD